MKALIRKTIIGFNRKESDRLLSELGGEGLIHISRWDTAAAEVSAAGYAGLEDSIIAMLDEIEQVCADLNISLDYRADPGAGGEPAPVIFDRDIESDRKETGAIRDELSGIRDLRQKYAAEHDAVEARLEAARDMAVLVDDPARVLRMSLCRHMFGTLRGEIDAQGRVLDDGIYIRLAGRHVLGICLPGAGNALASLLQGLGFEDKEQVLAAYAANPHALEEMRANAGLMKKELTGKEESLNGRLEETIGKLAGLHEIYSALKLSFDAKRGFFRTENTEFISCWIDLEDLDRLVSVLERVCGKRFYLHVFSRDEMLELHGGIPVRLRNRWFFRAFERIVRNAGVPRSLEVDPTPVATIAYLLMFGVMFGDIGQGLLLSLTGCIMKIIATAEKTSRFFP